MTSRRVSDDTLDNSVSDVSSADGAPVSPFLAAAVKRLAKAGGTTATFAVEPDPESVTAARHFAMATLRAWGLARLCDDVGLVASELVTNALRHSLPACPEQSTSPSIRLRLLRAAPYLLCGVVDSGSAVPRRREPDYIAESGRGLHIVECFSDRWGWSPLEPAGKIVWALFELPR
ncbi:MAG TPA: ATP-binding protein [Streptosporangiaceae bacterium]|nr:ATP-binding protein [Streptosporangiaceae bacterium]